MNAVRAGVIAAVALGLMAVLPRPSGAQQGPAALTVPHPLPPPLSTLAEPPRDLYQHPTPVPPIIYAPGYIYGPYSVYSPYGPYPSFGASMYTGAGYAFGSPTPPTPLAMIARGGLRFESSPGSAEVYVDGAYVGAVEDFGQSGRALDLDEGTHRVELRAAGYATLSFDVRIAANQTARYRGDLLKLSPLAALAAAPVAAPPAAPRATYIIPNCYVGDRPPSRALPSGCDLSKMRILKP